jgi:hypothetical protein
VKFPEDVAPAAEPASAPAEEMTPWGWRKPNASGSFRYSPVERQMQVDEIVRRMARCETHSKMSRDLGMPLLRVIRLVQHVEAMWRESAIESRQAMLEKRKRQLEMVQRETYEAWTESRKAAQVRSAHRTTSGTGAGATAEERASLVTRDQFGDASLLNAFLAAGRDIDKLFGLNAPDLVRISVGESVEAGLEEARRRIAEQRAEESRPN